MAFNEYDSSTVRFDEIIRYLLICEFTTVKLPHNIDETIQLGLLITMIRLVGS